MDFSDITIKCCDGNLQTSKFICAQNPILAMIIEHTDIIISPYSVRVMSVLAAFCGLCAAMGITKSLELIASFPTQQCYDFITIAESYEIKVPQKMIAGTIKQTIRNRVLSNAEMERLVALYSNPLDNLGVVCIEVAAPYPILWKIGFRKFANADKKLKTKIVRKFAKHCKTTVPKSMVQCVAAVSVYPIAKIYHDNELPMIAQKFIVDWCQYFKCRTTPKIFYQCFTGQKWNLLNPGEKQQWVEKLNDILAKN